LNETDTPRAPLLVRARAGETAGLALRIVESLGGSEESVRAAVEELLA
jgi:hypothetical protein